MPAPSHYAAIFGGAVSGAEAASQLAQKGIRTVVFEQNALPYGKIEDGLPKWHVKLRDKEEQNINNKLNNPLIRFVPKTKLGREIQFEDVVKNWGFSAILLAVGAWRDRLLPIDNIDEYIGKGFYYQNHFINWFNHFHEPGYAGQQYEIHDDAIVIGGGLASLDVVKALMMLTVQKALEERNHHIDIFTLDRSIAKALEELGLTLDDLGLKGCTLYYRRRAIDMPLSPLTEETPEMEEKAQKVREKILLNYQHKFLFRVKECHVPVDKIVESGRLSGIVFKKTKIENGKSITTNENEITVKSPLVISSIGSIPEPVEGIPSAGQTFDVKDHDLCQIRGYDNVFAIGNALTGKGNINESVKHGRQLSQIIAGQHGEHNLISLEKISEIDSRIDAFQKKAGYDSNYQKWIEKHLPVRLEKLLGVEH